MDAAWTKDLNSRKMEAIEAYKEAKRAYKEDMSDENWIRFCNAKRACMLLGCRI